MISAQTLRVCREGKPVPTFPDHALERSPAAKLELLHAVKLSLGERHRIIEAQRSERRGPDQADTYRRADDVGVVILQSQTGPRSCVGGLRRPYATGRVDFAGQGP